MPSPYHGIRPPYTLPSNVVLFHDWRYIDTGAVSWRTEKGNPVGLFTCDPFPPVHLETPDLPRGIRLKAQPAEMSEPVIMADDDEVLLFGGSLIHIDGMYRLWLESWPAEHFGSTRAGSDNNVRYFESDDGTNWRAPALGKTGDNIVYGAWATAKGVGYHGGCVFLDPSAPPEEWYKGWHLGDVPHEMGETYLIRRPDAVDAHMRGTGKLRGLFGAVSPDGIGWTPIEDPIVLQFSDTQNVCTYDSVRQKYVAYCRSWFFNRRTIGRMESDEFADFPLPEEVLWPNAGMQPYHLWYNNAKTIMPGTVDYHVMFPMRWDLSSDSFDFHLATSPDGLIWQMLPGGAVCTPGAPGSWNEGVVVPGVGLVDLPGDRTGLLIEGSPVPHKHPRRPPLGKIAWATWKKERLAALESFDTGSFSLWPLQFEGRCLLLNAETHFTGFVRVAAYDSRGRQIYGRGFDDCAPFNGDSVCHTVTWRGESDIGHAENEPVTFRFRTRNAKLYSLRFA